MDNEKLNQSLIEADRAYVAPQPPTAEMSQAFLDEYRRAAMLYQRLEAFYAIAAQQDEGDEYITNDATIQLQDKLQYDKLGEGYAVATIQYDEQEGGIGGIDISYEFRNEEAGIYLEMANEKIPVPRPTMSTLITEWLEEVGPIPLDLSLLAHVVTKEALANRKALNDELEEKTFPLLLDAACDEDLNPEIYKPMQAFRENLSDSTGS